MKSARQGEPGLEDGAVYGTVPPRSAAEQIDADLRAQGGAVRALVELGDAFGEAVQTIRDAIEGVALELDRERRGDRSTLARQGVDGRDFERLADSAIYRDENDLAITLHDAVAALTQRLQAVSPAARAHIDQTEGDRRDYRRQGAAR